MALEMISLKKPKMTEAQKKKQRDKEMTMDYEGDNYPYGARISFEKDVIEKIKSLQNIEAGAQVSLYGKGKVTEVRVTDSDKSSRKRHHVEIQITDIGVGTKKRPEDMNPGEYREYREKP